MAKNYIDNLAEETRKGQLEKARQGLWAIIPSPWLRNIAGSNGKRVIEPDRDVAPIITRMYEQCASGNYSLKEITAIVRAQGLAFRKNKTLVPRSTVHAILRNRIYIYG